MASQTPVYTPDQLERYLQRIYYSNNATTNSRLPLLQQSIHSNPLDTIAELQRRHLTSIPWGNSSLHYSQHYSISIDPQAVFEKLVDRRLDGYCMETTGLFYGVLRSLGYQVYPTGGRVSHQASRGVDDGLYEQLYVIFLFYGRSYVDKCRGHMVLIVTIEGEKYMVDVGFGSMCATRPLPLKENVLVPYIAPAEMRLIRQNIPEFTDKSQRVWIYQVRYTPQSDWVTNICFSELEFLSQDLAVMNFFTSKHPSSWFCQKFVCSMMIMDESEQEIVGQYVMPGKEVKRRMNGQTEVLENLESEDDRVQALAKWFGMHLREEEIKGIEGLGSQIK